jgi:hypothetical protein
MFGLTDPVGLDRDREPYGITSATENAPSSGAKSINSAVNPPAEIARCFLRLSHLPSFVFDRRSRYEVTLWRQVDQILVVLDSLDRRKLQERNRKFFTSNRPDGYRSG